MSNYTFVIIYVYILLFFFYIGENISKQTRSYRINKDNINERRRERYKRARFDVTYLTDGQKDNCTNIQHAQHQIDVNMSNFINETRKFEAKMSQCNLSHCMVCRQYRLGMQTLNGVCSRCSSSKNKFLFSHENKALPTWTRDGEIMYDIPKELAYLTMAEKLLIQRVSPLVPVIHIKNGILGVRGHIVSFFQDISSITRVLPRLPSEVSIIKVIRDSKTRYGNELKKAFSVDRRRVMKALLWLKKYNCLYKDIEIDESRLGWMGNCNTRELNSIMTISSESSQEDINKDR